MLQMLVVNVSVPTFSFLSFFESLEGADKNFVGDSKYDGSGINHADHIFAFNELVFGEQIDMMALARGETINVGNIELSNGYELPNVQLSSLQDYVDLGKRLYENVEEKAFGKSLVGLKRHTKMVLALENV